VKEAVVLIRAIFAAACMPALLVVVSCADGNGDDRSKRSATKGVADAGAGTTSDAVPEADGDGEGNAGNTDGTDPDDTDGGTADDAGSTPGNCATTAPAQLDLPAPAKACIAQGRVYDAAHGLCFQGATGAIDCTWDAVFAALDKVGIPATATLKAARDAGARPLVCTMSDDGKRIAVQWLVASDPACVIPAADFGKHVTTGCYQLGDGVPRDPMQSLAICLGTNGSGGTGDTGDTTGPIAPADVALCVGNTSKPTYFFAADQAAEQLACAARVGAGKSDGQVDCAESARIGPCAVTGRTEPLTRIAPASCSCRGTVVFQPGSLAWTGESSAP
jgi:hypothetical protein